MIMNEQLKLQCPQCRAIDWSRDGFAIAADPATGEILRRRLAPSNVPDEAESTWSCSQCGHALFGGTSIGGALHELQIAHLE